MILLTAPSRGSSAAPGARLTLGRRVLLAALLGAVALASTGARASPAMILSGGSESRSLAPYSDILSDTDGRLDIHALQTEAVQQQFRPTELGDLTLNGADAYWFRFTLVNQGDKALHHALQIAPANLQTVELYRGEQPLTPVSQGALRSQRLFSLDSPANSVHRYHLKVAHSHPQQLSLQLFDYPSLIAVISQQELSNAVFLGVLLAVMVFTSGRALLYRDGLFATLAGYCALIILAQAFAWGYLGEPQGLLPPWPGPRMVLIVMLVVTLEMLYGRWFPVYSLRRPGIFPLLMKGFTAVNLLAIALLLISGGNILALPLYTLVVLNGLLLTVAALVGYLHSYSRLLLCYLLTRIGMGLVYLMALLSYYSELISVDSVNYLLLAMTCLSALIHTALVLARHRKRQQQQALEAQRIAVLGEVSRAKTDILARVTHDIRTPMSAMLGASELLQETQLSGSQQDYIHTLQRSSQELLQLLEEVGQSARFNDREVELSKHLINLPDLIGDTLRSFRNLAAERSLELICDIDPALREHMLGDPSRIKQLLSHGMNSAFEHSESGHILLAVKAAESDPEQIVFELSHRGRPFTQQEKNALSHKAPSEDSRVNPRFAIIGQLAALMGGRVNARSTTNGINNLQIAIVLGMPKHRQPENARQLLSLQNKRLLVVDNNQTFREVIEKQCQHWGMQVLGANSEQTARALFRNQQTLDAPIDAVLVDYNLAGGSGLTLAQQLVEETPQAPPLILLLAHSNIKLSNDALLAARVRRVLSKPLSSVALRTALVAEMHFDASQSRITENGPRTTLRCLVAEDNPTNAQVLTRMLSNLGLSVSWVENGQQAVNSFMRQQFDVVFMDIEMPIMDGVEATKQIRAFERDHRPGPIPIFGLTANALDEQRDSYLQAGMDLHLIKPIRLWELNELILRWTDFQPEK